MKLPALALLAILSVSLLQLPTASGQEANARTFDIPATDDGLPGEGPIRRYPWFQNLWKSKRGAWAKQVEADQGALVFLGDSITQGWGDKMGGNFEGVKVANRGISGDTTRGMLIRLQEDVLALKPKGVVLLLGTNDLEEKAAPETTAANLKLILAELKKIRPEDARRSELGLSEFCQQKAFGRGHQKDQRALSGSRQNREAGHGRRYLDAVRR